MKAARYVKTKAEAVAELKRITGKDKAVNSDEVFIVAFDRPMTGKNILVTVDVNGKCYGTCNGPTPMDAETTAIYFSMKTGHDIDFVDGAKKSGDGDAACDLSAYKGDVVLSVYETGPQTNETYPTNLELIKRKVFTLS